MKKFKKQFFVVVFFNKATKFRHKNGLVILVDQIFFILLHSVIIPTITLMTTTGYITIYIAGGADTVVIV